MALSSSSSGRHRRWVRRAVAAAAAVGLGLVTAGCSGSSSAASGDGPATADSGPVTISYAIWEKPQLATMQKIADQFHQENPNITVNIQLTPWEQYWTKLQTSLKGGSAADVFWMNIPNLKKFANGGVLMPIDAYVKRDNVDLNNYVPAVMDAYKFKGHVYALPKDVDSIALWYNKDLFKAAGVDFPTADWTWDDLTSAAQKLTDPSKGVYGIAAPAEDQANYDNTILQAGGNIMSPDGKKSGLDSPEAIRGLRLWVDLINKYHASPTLQQMTDTDPEQMFTSGKVAMYYGGSWTVLDMKAVPEAKKFADVAPMPHDAQRYSVSNGLGMVINSKTKHPDAAWQWVKFLGGKKAAEIQAETGTVIPAYKGMADAWVKSSPEFNLQVFVDQLQYAKPLPSSIDTPAWRDATAAELAKAWAGTQSVEDAAKKAAQIMNDALANEGS
ncbi:MAG: ABC transporter substrate-binding protein [Actinomycetes bacterium]